MTTIRGATCVVTGAAHGLGRALALALARSGAARLFLCDLDGHALTTSASDAEVAGCVVDYRVLDVSDRREVEDWAHWVETVAGSADIVVNNAGVSVIAPLTRLDVEDIDWLMGVNFWGVVYGTKSFVPQMIKAGGGHIVNIASIYSVIAMPGQAAYNAAKFAMRGFTEAVAMELAPLGIHTSVVIPGCIRTDLVRRARFKGTRDPSVTHEVYAAKFAQNARTSPDEAAARILAGIRANASRILIGGDARFLDLVQRLFPAGYGKIVLAFLRR